MNFKNGRQFLSLISFHKGFSIIGSAVLLTLSPWLIADMVWPEQKLIAIFGHKNLGYVMKHLF